MTRVRQVLVAVVVAGMAYYAVEGGEYGTMDLLALRKQVRGEREAIARLRMDVDSLLREQQALANDPVVQERVARELYGMIRPGEILYQVVPRDTTER
ncbi:MAG: septum formation initiator family protein [Gemmatimonadales bacterium]